MMSNMPGSTTRSRFKFRNESLSGVITKSTVLLSPGASLMRLKSFNSITGTRHGTDQVMDIELNDFITCALAGVGDRYAYSSLACRSHLQGTDVQVRILESGITETMTEREK